MQQQHRLIASIVVVALVAAALGFFGGRKFAFDSVEGSIGNKANAASGAAISAKGTDSASAAQAMQAHTPRATKHLNSAVSNASAPPLPAAGTPLKQILADLKSRADAGDAAAASRLFQDMQTCAEAQRLSQFAPMMANQALNATNNVGQAPNGLQQRGTRMLDMAQRGLDFVSNNSAMCAGLTPQDMSGLFPATQQAAQMGDPQAANCYVGANLNTMPGVVSNPQWISDYQQNALPLATSALQQGDWAMASLLASANGGNPRSNNLLNQVTGTNLQQAYTYAKLMSLGQPTGTTPSNRSTNALTNLSGQLTPDQIQTADQQAQQMYQQYFNGTPRQTGDVANAMQACQGGVGI